MSRDDAWVAKVVHGKGRCTRSGILLLHEQLEGVTVGVVLLWSHILQTSESRTCRLLRSRATSVPHGELQS